MIQTVLPSDATPSATAAFGAERVAEPPSGLMLKAPPDVSTNHTSFWVDATNPAYGDEMTVTPPVVGSILVTPPASEKLIHHTDPWP